jgi:hypothetical protein
MGLDIMVITDKYDEIHVPSLSWEEYYNEYNLSRRFCDFMSRQIASEGKPELNRLGDFTGVDINPFYEMELYPDENNLKYDIEFAETEEEKQRIIKDAESNKELLKGNIDKVIFTLNNFIDKLNSIENLLAIIGSTEFDSPWNDEYFSDFQMDKGKDFVNNNFGQDLRNFKRYLELSKSKGATTAWFVYG